MTRKMTPRKKVVNLGVPILFGLPEKDHKWLKDTPWLSFNAIKQNKGSGTDWYNIAFRLQVGLNIARIDYTEETVNEFKQSFDIFFNSILRNIDVKPFQMTGEEIQATENLLEATDQITDKITRKLYVNASNSVFKQLDKRLLGMGIQVKSVKGER